MCPPIPPDPPIRRTSEVLGFACLTVRHLVDPEVIVLGGGVVGMSQLGVTWTTYIENATRFAESRDLWVGLLKALLFGVIIATVSCHEGFATTQGAVGVGMATRRSVVVSFLMVLIVGYFVTRLFY